MQRVYNQKNCILTVDGTVVQDFYSGTAIIFTYDGGEVEKTQGTDGAGINRATSQGATIRFTIRETSRSREFLDSVWLGQENGGPGAKVVFRSGANVLHSLDEAYISRPGELSTGDKQQGGIEYTLTAANDDTGNLGSELAGLITQGVNLVTRLL